MRKPSTPIEPSVGNLHEPCSEPISAVRAQPQARLTGCGRWLTSLVWCLLLVGVSAGFYWQQTKLEQLQQRLTQAEQATQQQYVQGEEQRDLTLQQTLAKQQLLASHLHQLKQQMIEQAQQQTVLQRALTVLNNQQQEHAALTVSSAELKQQLATLHTAQQSALQIHSEHQQRAEQQQQQLAEQQQAQQQLSQTLAERLAQQHTQLTELEAQQRLLQSTANELQELQREQSSLLKRVVGLEQQLAQPAAEPASLASLKADSLWLKMELEQLQQQLSRQSSERPTHAEAAISKQEFDAYKAQFSRRLAELERR